MAEIEEPKHSMSHQTQALAEGKIPYVVSCNRHGIYRCPWLTSEHAGERKLAFYESWSIESGYSSTVKKRLGINDD